MGRFLTNTQVSAACDSSPPLCREEIAECKCPKGIHSSVKQVRDKKCIGGERWLGSTEGKEESSVGRSVGRLPKAKVGCPRRSLSLPHPQKSNSSAPIYFVHRGERGGKYLGLHSWPHSRHRLEAPTARVHLVMQARGTTL